MSREKILNLGQLLLSNQHVWSMLFTSCVTLATVEIKTKCYIFAAPKSAPVQ